ncbi:MAG: hypothetical protein E7500_01460 [Ruminococcus sp.]|nr:hypothetical protein [Ruminococcus sp.]
MIDKLTKLIDVKSLVTLTLTLIFAVLSLAGRLSAEQFQTVFSTVIAFYFGTQHQKNSADKREGN